MKFDATYQGAVMQGAGALYEYADGSLYGTATVLDNTAIGRRVALTGYTVTSKRGTVAYQTTGGRYIDLSEGWTKIGTQAIRQYSQAQAQALVDKICANNMRILCCNLICARYANKLTSDQQQAVRDLQRRLEARNEALQGDGLCEIKQTSYPTGYAEYESYLQKLMAGEAVGVATWIVIVITAAVVLAATATAAYFAYKKLADESEQDVKFSQELTRTLTSKLTEEEYQQLLQETKGIVTKSNLRVLLGTGFNVVKMAAVAFAGYAIYRLIKNWKK